ncbi:hypothetical protein DPMN_075194 [Dreissena polymorpha]|uniref:Uncharacterized protein n=1 Tax=Dreissena polymorpha TaxID=45954 RepID=A0A9D3YGC7_DREPO|nr:hypothetical protein DPMN_075193 [Dreissena polymorpha]KAH3700223.1 hypothetical protein DPMN_075194 [Dreissena polymorpha]
MVICDMATKVQTWSSVIWQPRSRQCHLLCGNHGPDMVTCDMATMVQTWSSVIWQPWSRHGHL